MTISESKVEYERRGVADRSLIAIKHKVLDNINVRKMHYYYYYYYLASFDDVTNVFVLISYQRCMATQVAIGIVARLI